MTATYACTCGATGTAETTNKSDAASPDGKHAKSCTGVVITGFRPDSLARIVARVRGDAA